MPPDAAQLKAIAIDARENPGGFAHVPALDGIRGAAILLVLIDHLLWANPDTSSRILTIFSHIRESTYCGVNLFFALSGFLITGILFDTLDIPHYFKTFYARRTLRIFPLYYGFLLVLLLLTRPLHLVWSGWQYYYLTYSSNMALWRMGPKFPLDLHYFNINHFWSLQVEEQFYLVWPLIMYRFRRPQTIVRISLVSCAVVLAIRIFLVCMSGRPHFENIYLIYSPTFSCADNILFGCCLSALLRTKWRSIVFRFAPWVFCVCFVVLVAAGIQHGSLDVADTTFIPTAGFTLIGIACASLVAMALVAGSMAQRLFQGSVLRFFGRYSYGLYVYHYSLYQWLSEDLRAYFNNHLHSKGLSVVLGALVIAALSVAVAMLSYHQFEVRFLHLKRRFSYNRAAHAEPMQQTT